MGRRSCGVGYWLLQRRFFSPLLDDGFASSLPPVVHPRSGVARGVVSVQLPYGGPSFARYGLVAIVTGGARGLGRAYAKRLAGLGAKVDLARQKSGPSQS